MAIGNIPEKRNTGIFISQLVIFCNINRLFERFIDDFGNLVEKLCMKGFT